MSESMSSPWIRDYFMNVAETYGAQPRNAPVSDKKKKVQLTDLLTYQEDSYVWAWISDKDYRVPARISKDAVERYKSLRGRSVIDSRFFLVSISSYRPMFSPRPVGPNTLGNTPTSHISLEVDQVSSVGVGGHLFGNPRDLESDENMKEWALGLRQDGGGGNVLKLRKQQNSAETKKAPPPPPPLPLPFPPPPAPQSKITETVDVAQPQTEERQDLKRAYNKRWRKIQNDPWKLATKPVVEERHIQTPDHVAIEPHKDTASRLESCGPLVGPTPLHRTPSPTPSRRQGTPTEWSPSNWGSLPGTPKKTNTSTLGNTVRQSKEPEILLSASCLPSNAERQAAMDTANTFDICSPQPPTPAQRIKRSPIGHSSHSRCSPKSLAGSPPHLSQQLPHSSPLPPSSSLPFPSSLPSPTGIRKGIQRKVPHPGLPVSRPDPTFQGPTQILVPNSDTSGTGSSQSYSQSQQYQPQPLSRSPAFPSSLARELKPVDAPSPRREKSANTPRRTSKMSATSLPIRINIDEETTSTDDKSTAEKGDVHTGKHGPESDQPPALSLPNIEVLDVEKPNTEEDSDELQLIHGAPTRAGLDAQTRTRDTGEKDTDAGNKDDEMFVAAPQSSPPSRSPRSTVASVIQRPSLDKDSGRIFTQHSTQMSQQTSSRSPMHSLFSELVEDESTVSVLAPVHPVGRADDKRKEKESPAHVSRHDPVAWKEPSFIAKNKGKERARAVEEPNISDVKVGKKRSSPQDESPVRKRAKIAAPEGRRVVSGRTTTRILDHKQPRNAEAPTTGKIRSDSRPSVSSTDTSEMATTSLALRLTKPRLASFVVDFEKINLGKKVSIPRLELHRDVKSMLVRTGRIRTLGDEVEKDGSVYIMR